MHAYLLVSQNLDLGTEIKKISEKLKTKMLEYPLLKIEDVRELNKLIRLTLDKPTLIVLKNIHEAGHEALNAFLKNLEEPQENVYFALTVPSLRKVLPTIVSRCEIVRIKNQKLNTWSKDVEEFITKSVGERLVFTEKIKDRSLAIEFTENLINYIHSRIHSENKDYVKLSKNITSAQNALKKIKANGNISLQLTNLAISLV